MNRVLCDTCFWFGLFGVKDDYSLSANDWFSLFDQSSEPLQLLIPYPSLYETMNTSFCNNLDRLSDFRAIVDKYGELIPDDKYRDSAYEKVYTEHNYKGKRYSLVDLVIRSIVEDTNVQKDYLLTTNTSDFFDIAQREHIELLEIVSDKDYAKGNK